MLKHLKNLASSSFFTSYSQIITRYRTVAKKSAYFGNAILNPLTHFKNT